MRENLLDQRSRLFALIDKNSASVIHCEINHSGFETVVGIPCYGEKPSANESIQSLLRTVDGNVLLVVSLEKYSALAANRLCEMLNESLRNSSEKKSVLIVHQSKEMKLVNHWNFLIECALAIDECKFFAWGSDHDIWHPQWYQRTLEIFNEDPESLLAVPPMEVIQQGKHKLMKDKSVSKEKKNKIENALGKYGPGNSVYGLFSISVFKQGLRLHQVLLPDRLLLTLVALWHPISYASFESGPMWTRIELQSRTKVLSKQRKTVLNRNSYKIASYIPWTIVHTIIGLYYIPRISRESSVPKCLLASRLIAFEVRSDVAHRRKQIRSFRRYLGARSVKIRKR